MALSPKEQADFDEIVMRLRLEDTQGGAIRIKRWPTRPVMGLVAALLVVGLGVVLLDRGVLGPVFVVTSVAGSGVMLWRFLRARNRVAGRTRRRI